MQRACANGRRNIPLVATVSTRALIGWGRFFRSGYHEGVSPQRAWASSRSPWRVRTTGTVVVGATFVGQDVAELLHSATVAVAAGLTLGQLWHAVPSYPTVSEGWLRLLEAAGL